MIQAYIRLKLIIGIRRGNMLRLRMSDLTDAGIMVRPHKTMNTRRTARIFEWTSGLKEAVEKAKAARPIDFSPWLFCTRKGKGYFNQDSGQATGWDSMWQRFMTRLLKDTDIKERFTEHDLRGKVGSDEVSIERATDLLESHKQRDYKAALSTQSRSNQAGPLTRIHTRAIQIHDARMSRCRAHAHES